MPRFGPVAALARTGPTGTAGATGRDERGYHRGPDGRCHPPRACPAHL